MNQLIQFSKDGTAVDLSSHPSMLALLHAQDRFFKHIEAQKEQIETEIGELDERESLYLEIGQPVQGIRAKRTRRRTELENLEKQESAGRAGYLEVPNMGGEVIESNETESRSWWHENLPADTPLDVVRAIAHAQKAGVFDEFQIFKPPPRSGADPIIVGVAGGAVFYVGSWR